MDIICPFQSNTQTNKQLFPLACHISVPSPPENTDVLTPPVNWKGETRHNYV